MKFLERKAERIASRVGAFPARRVTWGLVAIFSLWVLLDVLVFKFTGGLSRPSYDAMVRARIHAAAPDPRIVIVDIDEASLLRMGKEFGRWPWPRDTLATVLNHIEKQKPAAIIWDVVFSDADRLSPGGDAAFNEAARHSLHSHFSVVRLPPGNDSASQITHAALPGLWVPQATPPPAKPSTVALIPPALPAIAGGRLGFNNGYVDPDGVLRRYRYTERLADGSQIQSIVMSVLGALDTAAYKDHVDGTGGFLEPADELMVWRKKSETYPRVSFANVFAQAEGDKPPEPVPGFAGKVILVGATASSLYDIHPTPLSSMQTGVDSLATALDNALNQRHLAELPRWLQATVAIALCVALALWVQFKSVASLAPALFALPIALLGVSYLSLNGLPIFLDLHLAAGLALVFLAVLRGWNTLRRNHWCSPPPRSKQAMAIWAWQRSEPWLEGPLDRLIDAVERHAPSCRIVVCDSSVIWPNTLRWPELARFAAIVGPHDELLAARVRLEPALKRLARRNSEPKRLEKYPNRELLVQYVFSTWATLQREDSSTGQSVTSPDINEANE